MFKYNEENGNKLELRLDANRGVGLYYDPEIPEEQPNSTGIYVKISRGLTYDDLGRLAVDVDTTKGLGIIGQQIIIKLGEGVEFDENGCISATGAGNALTFTDINGNSIEYKPSADPKTITLGRGLQITDE